MSTQNSHTHNTAIISITNVDSGSDYRVYVRTNFSDGTPNWGVFNKAGYSWADVYNGVLVEGLEPETPYAANVQTPSHEGVWLGATTFTTHAAPAGSNSYIWNGSSWVVATPYIWNGSSWVLVSSKVYTNAWS